MIDFRDKNLYRKEKVKMNNFLNKKLLTGEEAQELELSGEDDELIGSGDFLAGDAFDLDSGGEDFLGDDSGGLDSFGSAGDRSGVKGDMGWKHDNPFITFFRSPLFMIKYVFQDMTEDFPNVKEWKGIIKVLNTINIICILTALLALLIGLKTIFTPEIQLIVGGVLFVTTTLITKFGYKEDTKTISIIKKVFGIDSKEEDLDDVDDLDLGDGSEEDGGFEFSDFGDMDVGSDIVEDEEEIIEDDVDEDSRYTLKDSPIDVSSDEEFERTLLRTYKENEKNAGRVIQDRLKMVKSFSDYLIQSEDNAFGKWTRPRIRGVEYNNIAYALYKGICQVDTSFSSYTPKNEDEDIERLIIHDIRKSPLLYRVEVELPQRIKEKRLQANVKVMEDMLKSSEEDLNVMILISTFQGNIIFKIMRLDNPPLVSIGDILRFTDEDKGNIALQAYDNPKRGLPILFGLQNNEYPYIVDIEDNTCGAIVGGSGSGKSWTTFSMMMNFVISNDYNNVNFIVLDAKNAPFWGAFARFPHVLGYHYDVNTFIPILHEVRREMERRQEVLNTLGEESVKGYRERLRRNGNFEELKKLPLLVVVVDEITATMIELKEQDESIYKEMKSILGSIATRGRSAGVRILSIGQRSVDESIPKILMANSSFKFGMKMDVENDFEIMFGNDIKNYKKPSTTGMGLSKVEGVSYLQSIKTLTMGGTNDQQLIRIIRALAFDWIRRSHGVDNLEARPDGTEYNEAYNRNMFLHMSKVEMEEGRVLSEAEVSEGYEFYFDERKREEKESNVIDMEEDESEVEEVFEPVIEEDEIQDEEEEIKNDGSFSFISDVVGTENTFEEEEKEVEENHEKEEFPYEEDEEEGNQALWNELNNLIVDVDDEDEDEIPVTTETSEIKKQDYYEEGTLGYMEESGDIENDESKKQDNYEKGNLEGIEDLEGTETEESKKVKESEYLDEGEGLSLEDLMKEENRSENKSEEVRKEEGTLSEYVSEEKGKDEGTTSEIESEVGEENGKSSEKGKKKGEKLRKDIEEVSEEREEENVEEIPKESKKEESVGLELGFESAVPEQKDPKRSIKSYIMEYGQARGLNFYMKKEELAAVYTQRKIEESLDRMLIVEKDGYYIAKM